MSEVKDEVKSNLVLGTIGALMGALLGGTMWVGLYQLGVIAGFAGIAIIYLSCKGNALLSKNLTIKHVIISIIISILVLLAAQFLSRGMSIHIALAEEYEMTFTEALLAVPSVAFSESNIVDFIKELLIGLILIASGSVPFIRNARNINTPVETL